MHRLTTSFLAVLVAVAAAAPAKAFFVESRFNNGTLDVPLRFGTMAPIEWRLVTSGLPGDAAAIGAAIDAAFETWEAQPCANIAFTRGPDEMNPPPGTMPQTYVAVQFTNDPGVFSTPQVGRFVLAHDGMGGLTGAIIQINTVHHMWSTAAMGEPMKMDVQGVLTGLIGRSLGITSIMTGNATYPSYAPGDTSKRTLGMDDINAINFLYGDAGMCMIMQPERICRGPTDMPACPPPIMTNPMTDGGVPGEGGVPVPTDGSAPMPPPGPGPGPTPTPDVGPTPPPGPGPMPGADAGSGGGSDDGGCCAVLDSRSDERGVVLVGLGLVALALRRRTRRTR